MKKPLNPEDKARRDEALRRIEVAQDRDSYGRIRSRIIAGAIAVTVVVGIAGTLYGMTKAEHAITGIFSDENQNPGGPQLSGEPARTPLATTQSKAPTNPGNKMSADLAQRQVEKAMGVAGVPVLSEKGGVGGSFSPKDPQALQAYLESARTDYRSENANVRAALGDAAVNCSTFITLGAIQKVPEGIVRSMLNSLGSNDWATSAANCEAGVMQAQALSQHLRVSHLNY